MGGIVLKNLAKYKSVLGELIVNSNVYFKFNVIQDQTIH